MSKLAKSVMANNTHVRRAGLSPRLCTVDESFVAVTDIDYSKEFKIGVTLAKRVVISDGADIAPAVLMVKRSIIEEVFGEFRQYFRRIDEALWDQNLDEAKRVLSELHEAMFSVDGD